MVLAWFGPKDDRTFYQQNAQGQFVADGPPVAGSINQAIVRLFDIGEKKKADDKKEVKKKQIAIKYSAPQIIGGKNAVKFIRSGTKLVGFLMTPIDTRSPAPVRVRILRGGESNGVAIEMGSILTGQYSYPGSGNKIFISFARLDNPEGDTRRIQAQALDSGTYTSGISGKIHSDEDLKVAAQLGLSMFSGMADVLTEKESLGVSANGVQAKSTMKNAMLQGFSRAAQDQTGRMASEVNNTKDYLTVSEGKEMIIELLEDFK